MPLVSILDQLKKAQENKYAIPSFNAYEMLGTQGILAALEAKRAPGIVALYTGLLNQSNPRPFTEFMRAMAEDATVPVSIILDHGISYEQCMKALSLGLSDVMYDGSKLPLEKNIANTRRVVQAAHALGAAVEAELGHVGAGSDYQSFGARRKGFTDPETVEKFVKETGVDFLAVAIGTAHGVFDGEPKLDLDLLAEIRERTDIPLALHGGSGLSDDQFRAAIAGGVAKINIGTNLVMEASQRMIQKSREEDASFWTLTAQIREGYQDQCARFLDVFGATNKA